MREFRSFGEMAAFLAGLALEQRAITQQVLRPAAEHLQKKAKEKFGSYQEGFAEYAAWPELAERTKADRVQLGYPENDPLEREGDLREGIGIAYGPSKAEIGSNDDVMVAQELGTETIPPRPVLGLTGAQEEKAVFEMVGEGLVKALIR